MIPMAGKEEQAWLAVADMVNYLAHNIMFPF